jgi:hypothetical protein
LKKFKGVRRCEDWAKRRRRDEEVRKLADEMQRKGRGPKGWKR